MEEKLTEDKVISTQKQLHTSHDPGWNDPPKWAYSPSPTLSGSIPTKRLLNKRVAFPLNSTFSSSSNQQLSNQQSSSSINLPPPPLTQLTTAPHAPLLAPSAVSTQNSVSDITIDKEQGLNDTLDNLNIVLSKMLINDSKIEEIQKRLGIMKSMWIDNKLNNEIHEKVFEISKALQSNDIETADKMHVSLIMNYGTACNAWICAIRHLILIMKEKKNVESNKEITNNSQPLLLPNPSNSNE